VRPSDQPTFTSTRRTRRLEYVPGQIIVRLHADAVLPAVEDKQLPEAVAGPLDWLLEAGGSIRALFADRPRPGGQPATRREVVASVTEAPEGLRGVVVVELPAERVPQRLITRVASAPAVDYV
jgi:hypothetical protein